MLLFLPVCPEIYFPGPLFVKIIVSHSFVGVGGGVRCRRRWACKDRVANLFTKVMCTDMGAICHDFCRKYATYLLATISCPVWYYIIVSEHSLKLTNIDKDWRCRYFIVFILVKYLSVFVYFLETLAVYYGAALLTNIYIITCTE